MIGAWIAIGAGAGVALGLILDNLALGIAIGAAIGTAIGASVEGRDIVRADGDTPSGGNRVGMLVGLGLILGVVAAGVVLLLLLSAR
jgi:hypothetical protein